MMPALTKSLSLILIITIAFVSIATQCNKNYIEQQSNYHFIEKLDLEPSQKSYLIGDTIWLGFQKANKQLFEGNSKKNILVDSASITFQFGFSSPNYPPPNLPTTGLCDYVVVNGGMINKFQDQNEGLMATFGCNNENSYDFRIGIILKQKGVFEIWLNTVSRQVAKCGMNNSTFPISEISFTFNLSDCNKDVFLSLAPDIQGYFSSENFDDKKAFIFNVE